MSESAGGLVFDCRSAVKQWRIFAVSHGPVNVDVPACKTRCVLLESWWEIWHLVVAGISSMELDEYSQEGCYSAVRTEPGTRGSSAADRGHSEGYATGCGVTAVCRFSKVRITAVTESSGRGSGPPAALSGPSCRIGYHCPGRLKVANRATQQPTWLPLTFDDMRAQAHKVDFLAVLIYEDGENRYSEEPHVISASHPEIAYQIAMSRGGEQRYGRRFVGLSHLEPAVDKIKPIACSRGGNADNYVSSKNQLAAFSDPRWSDVECTEEEVAEALREPPLLVELEGLNDVPWHTLTHAYGPAVDVPIDLRRIGSSDPQLRKNAVWQLGGSIYHQGTLYPATAFAIPFLIRLAANHTLPIRQEVCGLLEVIAESCTFEEDRTRKAWAWRKESFGEIYDAPSEEMAEREIASCDASRSIMIAHLSELQSLATDDDPEVAESGMEIIEHLGQAET